MSIVIERVLYCNGPACNETGSFADGDMRHYSSKKIREEARDRGWVTIGSRDYCKECAEKRKKR